MNNKQFDDFVKEGRTKGFTDDQINFLWDWINKIACEKALSGGFI